MYAEIISDPLTIHNVGMIGKISRAFQFDKETFYEITAENYGPYLSTESGATKKVRAWMPGNHRALTLEHIKPIND